MRKVEVVGYEPVDIEKHLMLTDHGYYFKRVDPNKNVAVGVYILEVEYKTTYTFLRIPIRTQFKKLRQAHFRVLNAQNSATDLIRLSDGEPLRREQTTKDLINSIVVEYMIHQYSKTKVVDKEILYAGIWQDYGQG